MAGIETYGGSCPECLRGMIQKFESSWTGYIFEACPHCGFIYVQSEKNLTDEQQALHWEKICNHFGVNNRDELICTHNLPEYCSPMDTMYYPSIFDHSAKAKTLLIYKMLYQEYGREYVVKEIKGQRVYSHENQAKKGTIMSYEAGIVYILWDEYEDLPLPPLEYPATEMGKSILLVKAVDTPVINKVWIQQEVLHALDYLEDKKGINVNELRTAFLNSQEQLIDAYMNKVMEKPSDVVEKLEGIVSDIRALIEKAC